VSRLNNWTIAELGLKRPKGLLNYNASSYDPRLKLYKTQDGRLLTYKEALRHKWKCEKCPETFPSFYLLKEHRNEFHSY
jgi:hypothetical protein